MLWNPTYIQALQEAERIVLARQREWDPREYVPHVPPAGGGGGGFSGAFALITSKAGTSPPYRYAAAQATMDADGVWTEVENGTAYNDVFNFEEQGDGGQWVNPLLVGDVVLICPAPDPSVEAWVCVRGHYRGTY